MGKILDKGGQGMENLIVFIIGVLFGFMFGVLSGRRSIVKEAQALVAQAIMEVRKHAR
jgi:hypothetical protein